MSSSLPPPPPRHPSSRAPKLSSIPAINANNSRPSDRSTDRNVPGRHPNVSKSTSTPSEPQSRSSSSSPLSLNAASSSPSTLPLPPKHSTTNEMDETSRKLAEIEDLEVAEMLDRVGGQLQEIRVQGEEERTPIEYPNRFDFRDEDGKLDWASFAIAYLSTLVLAATPPDLICHPPQEDFSLRFVRDDLSRFYVLCPPSVWQDWLLRDVARLYRWDDPTQTGKYAALYAFLVFFDLVPLFPIGLLLYHMILPRLSPPTPEELLATSNERRSRTAEAAELSKQLQNSSAGRGLGFAAEGIRGVFQDLRGKLPIGRSPSEEKSLAHALGSTALLGGMAGSAGNYNETLRQRLGKNHKGAASPEPSGTTKDQDEAEGVDEDDLDPCPATDKTGEVSLYRLVRNLARSFGPHIQTVLSENVDLFEVVRNVIQHPDHPASMPVLLRLIAVFVLVLLTTWLRLKSAFAYLGIEFFVLWKVREMFPQYRRATMIQWWIFSGAPTDAEYALYVLRKRGAEGRAIRGSKTIRRMARRSRTSSNADLNPTVQRLAKSVSDTASISSSSSVADKTTNTYFAFHHSVPGQIVLTSTTFRFIPAKRIRKLGFQKIVARVAQKFDPTIELDESYYYNEDGGSHNDSTGMEGMRMRDKAEVEMAVKVREIETVKKEKQFRLPALVISSKDGEIWKFTNVSRRDDAFNKLLSFSAAPGTAAYNNVLLQP
ncbi:uncharacterized protein JCM6883_001559 [Sporobolomyces salmoneus]|uniref:uncharacterized protein n=1 Tax=Sporobolomyces salmoneus TaxID=183962 RepID=UPI00317123F9